MSKTIIEKLDIEKIDISWFDDKDHVLLEEVRKVETERDKLLEAFIEILEEYEMEGFPDASFRFDGLFKDLSGKSWKEIKELS